VFQAIIRRNVWTLSGVEAAIRELEREQKRIRDVILMLKRILQQNADPRGRKVGSGSPRARRRISEAAKKHWTALRASSKSRK